MAFAKFAPWLRSAIATVGVAALVPSPLLGQATDSSDDGMLVTEGPSVSPGEHRGDKGDWLKIDTDSCGLPVRMENRESLLASAGMDEQIGEPDLLENLQDLGPADKAWALVAMSISPHSNIAVISDGVGKTCDDGPLDDDDFGPETIAAWRGATLPPAQPGGARARSEPPPYIA